MRDLVRFVAPFAQALRKRRELTRLLLGQRLPVLLRLEGFGIEERLLEPVAQQ